MDVRSDEEIRSDLSFLVDKASEGLAARMAAALAAIDLTVREYCVLAKADSGELTQGQIAEIALLDKTTMVVTLDGLEVTAVVDDFGTDDGSQLIQLR